MRMHYALKGGHSAMLGGLGLRRGLPIPASAWGRTGPATTRDWVLLFPTRSGPVPNAKLSPQKHRA